MERILKILVLEDRKSDYEICKRYVLKALPNCMFTHAQSEEEFLKKLEWSTVDLILADYHIPGYSGLTALMHVKEKYPSLPFIFVSGALNSEEKSADAIIKGADGFIAKDNVKTLHEEIIAVMERTEARNQLRQQQEKEEMTRKLTLQKAIALVSKASDFPERQQVVTLLESCLAPSTVS